MRNKSRLFWLVISFAASVVSIGWFTTSVRASFQSSVAISAIPVPTPATGTGTGKVTTSDGLTVVTFEPPAGTVRVYLPDDMRAGDTISGTVAAEPKGQTEEERAKNLAGLNGYTITLGPQSASLKEGDSFIKLPVNNTAFNFKLLSSGDASLSPNPGLVTKLLDSSGSAVSSATFSLATGIPALLPGQNQYQSLNVYKETDPLIGQQGRYVSLNTYVEQDPEDTRLFMYWSTMAQDNVRTLPADAAGNKLDLQSRPLNVIAESPRKMVFETPTDITGMTKLEVRAIDSGEARGGGNKLSIEPTSKEDPSKKPVDPEGRVQITSPFTRPFRIVGVRLSAPKTNLMRGERTTLTVEVRGLEGIKEDVPLQLDSKGVITMDGGNFQNLRIKPSEVTPAGLYTTNRAITGVQAGGFTVTATVIVRRFDFNLQDDSDPNRIFHFNSFTGDYVFACGGGSCRPGSGAGTGQTGAPTGQTGGTANPPTNPTPPTALNLTGIGKPAMKGCIITLSHNAPDRRIFARLDTCTKSGEASVETTSPKADFKITDKNTADNTAASPPPK